MIRRPPRSTRTDTLCPYTTLFLSLYIVAKSIFEGKPIQVFNHDDMQRDFTYIDDIVDGVIRVLDNPPPPNEAGRPYRLYNIGNHRSEQLLRMIEILEQTIGRKAEKQLLPMQEGDEIGEHTSELQSLMRISYAVFCLKKKNKNNHPTYKNTV